MTSPPQDASIHSPWTSRVFPPHGGMLFAPGLDSPPHYPSLAQQWSPQHSPTHVSVGDSASVAEAIQKQRVLGTPSSASRVQSPKKSKKVEPERFCALKNVLVLQSTMLKVQDALFGRACRFAYAHVNIQRDLRCVSNRIHAIL